MKILWHSFEKPRFRNLMIKSFHMFYKPSIVQYTCIPISDFSFILGYLLNLWYFSLDKSAKLYYAKVTDKKSHTSIQLFPSSNKLYFVLLKFLTSFLPTHLAIGRKKETLLIFREGG